MQALAQELGGRVESSDLREFGHADLVIENDETLLEGLSDNGSFVCLDESRRSRD